MKRLIYAEDAMHRIKGVIAVAISMMEQIMTENLSPTKL